MRRTFAIAPHSEVAIARGDAFKFLAYAAQLRRFATTGKRRQSMDHKGALDLASWQNSAAKRMGFKLP